jgi:RNA polymerase sigma factor (sigma-70 family)
MSRANGTTLFSHLRRILGTGSLASAADEELLGQFVEHRDEAAFGTLVRRHGAMVWGVCRRLLANCEDAEDAFQATFLLLACKAALIERRKQLANWLFGVARRSALRVRAVQARRARFEKTGGDLPDVTETPEHPWDDVRAVLDEELARIPAKYRLPLLLCGLEGLTHAEASKSLGWPIGTVSARLSRGRDLLRSRLLRRGVTAPAVALTAVLAAAARPAPRLATAVCNSASAVVARKSAAAGVPPAVLAPRTMAPSRCGTTTALLVALAVTLGGAGVIWHLTRPVGTPPAALEALAQQPLERAAGPQSASRRRAVKEASGKPDPRLPTDPSAVVLRIDRSVGGSNRPGMALTICVDGRVIAEVPDGLISFAPTDLTSHVKGRVLAPNSQPQKSKVLEGRLSARELNELLRFALDEQKFFDFDPAAVRFEIREKYQSDGTVADSTDATATTFRIRTADRTHEVRWSRLAKTAWDFPDVKRLHQLYAVDRRLQQVFYVLVADGPERVEAAAEKANALARPYYRRFPELPRLTAADLFRVTPSADGSRMQFTFSRNQARTIRRPLFEVTIDVPRLGEPTLLYAIPPQATGSIR